MGKRKAKAVANPLEAGRRAAKRPKPKGMRWVNPYLTVRDVAAALDWYENAFGFGRSLVMSGPDGKPVHAEMLHRKSVIMLGPEAPGCLSRAPAREGGSPVALYCYCDDVDALAARARAAGAKIVEDLQDQFWGDRTCFLIDPEGHCWTFATRKFDLDPKALEAARAAGAAESPAGGEAQPAETEKVAAKDPAPPAPPAASPPAAPPAPPGGIDTALGKLPAKA